MTNSGGAKQRWQELYDAVSAETDREKVTKLINRTEEALMVRAQELAQDANHSEERNAMVQASENLLVIKTEKLRGRSAIRFAQRRTSLFYFAGSPTTHLPWVVDTS
jgi:hypothetical protein